MRTSTGTWTPASTCWRDWVKKAGLIDAVASGSAPGAGAALVERLSALAPSLRVVAIGALFRRAEWTAALVDALEKNQVRLSELALELFFPADDATAETVRRTTATTGRAN